MDSRVKELAGYVPKPERKVIDMKPSPGFSVVEYAPRALYIGSYCRAVAEPQHPKGTQDDKGECVADDPLEVASVNWELYTDT